MVVEGAGRASAGSFEQEPVLRSSFLQALRSSISQVLRSSFFQVLIVVFFCRWYLQKKREAETAKVPGQAGSGVKQEKAMVPSQVGRKGVPWSCSLYDLSSASCLIYCSAASLASTCFPVRLERHSLAGQCWQMTNLAASTVWAAAVAAFATAPAPAICGCRLSRRVAAGDLVFNYLALTSQCVSV